MTTPTTIRLADYAPFPFVLHSVEMVFQLHSSRTVVTTRIEFERKAGHEQTALKLDGDGLKLLKLSMDGRGLNAGEFVETQTGLEISNVPDRFTLLVETEVDPSANTALSGLYRSSGNYCTQCEAEGFRRITFYPDRPDVMSVFTVRMEASAAECPVMLANGNPVASGALEGGRHFAVWHDPWPKPAYLFAVVAGDLAASKDRFVTASGRDVELAIYTEHGKSHLTDFAMDALKRSMRWDEERFGCIYDLDVFNIVAVSDFNMGAMENKGLNIFNDRYVLADPALATDQDYANIEAIIAHEYFHNWTGNRITCRDWFQLCLKEGLTVFRDHEFSADMRSRPVKRIAEIRTLMAQQFPEDGGPLAHPVRPNEYVEINNFYTATVYEKGSEIVRMLQTMLGADAFADGLALYLRRHDGEAATVEQFIACFTEASGEDLSQFFLWYLQAGTPQVTLDARHDAERRTFSVTLKQSQAPTPGQAEKLPLHIPVAFGLVGPNGDDMDYDGVEGGRVDNGVMHLTQAEQTFVFRGVASPPVLSAFRGLSAPVAARFTGGGDLQSRLFLARNDADPVSRWQALNGLETECLVTLARAVQNGDPLVANDELVRCKADLVQDERLDLHFRALCGAVPAETDIARELSENVDVDAVRAARLFWMARLAGTVTAGGGSSSSLRPGGAFAPTARQAGARAIANVLLEFECVVQGSPAVAAEAFDAADNMTDRLAALTVLVQHFSGAPEATGALDAFRALAGGNGLALDKWLALVAMTPGERALDKVKAAFADPTFDSGNPNRMRALLGSFAMGNPTGFHRRDGEAYAFFADRILAFDRANPQVAARMLTAVRSWRSLEPTRRELLRAQVAQIARASGLSRDSGDIAARMLA
jgi:aminopeptidase N